MAYRISMAPHGHNVVVLTYSGAVTIEERAAALNELLRWLSETAYRKVLVDFEQGRVVATTFEASNRHAANLARAYGNLPGLRFAYVSAPDPNTTPIVETLASARGFYYERFDDHASALEWLK